MTDSSYQGILAVDKASGPTSHDVVAQLRRLVGQRRIGHCGTLDPLATGLLVVCLGRYTRLSQWIMQGEKEYWAVFRLGVTSNTGDADGTLEVVDQVPPPTIVQVRKGLEQFVGAIDQVPPAFSALKVNGVRSYRLARQQQAVKLKSRPVHIAALELVRYTYPDLEVRMVCSQGTYVRSVAVDLGQLLECGAHVAQLRRTRIGPLVVERAHTVDQFAAVVEGGKLKNYLIEPQRALGGLASLVLAEKDQHRAFVHGNSVMLPCPPAAGEDRTYAVYDGQDRLCGIGRWRAEQGHLQPLKVLQEI
ncbi:MAG: tRNA pseudouridine(55) synthase TruB [Candidatus Latescibacteria bacterium]|nr:tRNA pseudouridine(55) synthase TruB [Candidatus Latescibacterota bacterium]